MVLKKRHVSSGPIAEKQFWDTTDNNNNMLIPWYLMAAYAYYEQDDPILEDTTFDKMAKKLKENWNEVEHMHKHLLTVDMLEAGTFLGDYPNYVKGAVEDIRNNC